MPHNMDKHMIFLKSTYILKYDLGKNLRNVMYYGLY